MGNTHSNRIGDNQRRQGSGNSPSQQQQNESQSINLRPNPNNFRSSDIEIKTQSIAKSKLIYRKGQPQNGQNASPLNQNESSNNQVSYFKTPQSLKLKITAHTWYRDSHGLFDYEEDKKMTTNHLDFHNQNFLLMRDTKHKDTITFEKFQNFNEMRANQKYLQELQADEMSKSIATCILKNNNYWIYHKNTIEDAEEEKALPGEKLWLIMRHMSNDPEHNFESGQGFKLELGDTIKFGRVRYKVIMMHNRDEGQQDYMLTDRFQKHKHDETLKASGYDLTSHRGRRRRSTMSGDRNSRSTSPIRDSAQNIISPERANSHADIPRFQSQVTQFDAGFDARESSFYDNDHPAGSYRDDAMSQDMGDSEESEVSSSDYTGSGDYQENYSDNLSVREEEADAMEDLQTVQQQDDQTAYNYQTQQTGLTGGTLDTTVISPQRGIGRIDSNSFMIGRFNSVAPSDNVLPDMLGNQSSHAQFISGDQQQLQDTISMDEQRRFSNQGTIRDTTGFGQTGLFFSHNRQNGAAGANRTQVHGQRADGIIQTISKPMDNDRNKRRSKKYKKNQKQKLKFQLQLEARAKEAIEGKVCRICLGDENDAADPLISPCKCAGTMSHIHLSCLREWLNSKRSMKEGDSVKTYCWKALECELCKARFPGQIFSDGTSVSDKMSLTAKQQKKLGKPIEILEYEKPESDYIVIESVTLQNIRIVHVISMKDRPFIRVGRGHDADIRVTDISVSRFHAKINMSETGEFYVEDNRSKFGTLIQLRKPYMLDKNRNNYIQMGRTTLTINIEDTNAAKVSQGPGEFIKNVLCCKKSKKVAKSQKEICLELYPSEWHAVPQESPLEYNNTIVEQTRDDENIVNAASSPDGQLLQVLPVGQSNDPNGSQPSARPEQEQEEQKQEQEINEEPIEEIKQDDIESNQNVGQDNAMSVLEDQTLRAILAEHEVGQNALEETAQVQINDNELHNRDDQNQSAAQANQRQADLSFLGHLEDSHQQNSPPIADLKTGCEKISHKFGNIQVAEGISEEQMSDAANENNQILDRQQEADQQEISVLDNSLQDQTYLLSNNQVNNTVLVSQDDGQEETKHDTTVKKNLNNSQIEQISPNKEEDEVENDNNNEKDQIAETINQIAQGSQPESQEIGSNGNEQ